MRIVLVIADSLRADAPGHAGGPCCTPTMDRMATEGVAFRTVVTSAPWTVPSVAAMLTGVYAHRLGLYRWEQPWPARFPSVFGALAAANYRVASFVFDPRYLFAAVPEAGVVGSSQAPDEVIRWLEGCTERNLFLCVHYWGTHVPYLDVPMDVEKWKELTEGILSAMRADPSTTVPKVRGLYQRAVERLSERFLPRILAAAASHAGPDGCAVVVVGDHGETWGERDAPGGRLATVFDLHGNDLSEEVLRVPMIVWGARGARPRATAPLVRTVDLAPTLRDLAQVPAARTSDPADAIDGLSLASCLRGDVAEPSPRSAVAARSADFLQTSELPEDAAALWQELCLRSHRWKYLWTPASGKRAVFDLESDPTEEHPRRAGSGEPADGWATLAAEWARAACAPPADVASARLRALGYVE